MSSAPHDNCRHNVPRKGCFLCRRMRNQKSDFEHALIDLFAELHLCTLTPKAENALSRLREEYGKKERI